MPISRRQLSMMLCDAFESLEEQVDSPITFHFKGFNQTAVQDYLDEWLSLSQRDDASLRMAASYSHVDEIIQVWFYYNDYHPVYYDEDSNSVIGISDELSESDKESEGSDEE